MPTAGTCIRALLVAAAMLAPHHPALAQTPVVAGRVLDAVSLVPIAGATVSAEGRDVVTDRDGRFALDLAAREIALTVTAPGYLLESRRVALAPGASSIAIEVLLVNATQFRELVNVSAGGGPADLPVAATPVTPLEVRSVAGAVLAAANASSRMKSANQTARETMRMGCAGVPPRA